MRRTSKRRPNGRPLHLHTREDEWPYRLRIIVANLFGYVVLVRPIPVALFFGIAAEAYYLNGAVNRDQAVLIDLDEFFEEAVVGAAADVAVLRVDVAEAGGFQEDEGEHR